MFANDFEQNIDDEIACLESQISVDNVIDDEELCDPDTYGILETDRNIDHMLSRPFVSPYAQHKTSLADMIKTYAQTEIKGDTYTCKNLKRDITKYIKRHNISKPYDTKSGNRYLDLARKELGYTHEITWLIQSYTDVKTPTGYLTRNIKNAYYIVKNMYMYCFTR
jgi:hypothetical protein